MIEVFLTNTKGQHRGAAVSIHIDYSCVLPGVVRKLMQEHETHLKVKVAETHYIVSPESCDSPVKLTRETQRMMEWLANVIG